MLSEHHLRANLTALAAAGTPAPALGRVEPDRLRVTLRDGRVDLAIRTASGDWSALVPGSAAIPREARTVCLVGAQGGRGIEVLRTERPDLQLVVVEPDPAHALVMLSSSDWSEAIRRNRLVVLIGPDYPGSSTCAGKIDVSASPHVCLDEGLAANRQADVERARHVVGRIFREAQANLDARRAFAPRYLLQTLENLPAIARGGDTAALQNRFPGIPALIVGAGPSLDDQSPDVAALADRAIVIASDTALSPLRAAGIDPPLVLAVDPSEWNARHLAGTTGNRGSWLVAEGSVHPTAVDRFAGRTFFFEVSGHEPWPWFREHGLTRGRVRAWGSVVTSAFDLALRMGCNPIVFAGLDLAFTGGRTYCRGTAHEEIWGQWIAAGDTWENVWKFLVSRQPQQTERDLHGASAITTPYLAAFRNWLVEQVNAAPGDRRFINTTGAGIMHGPRIEQASLQQTLGGLPRVSMSDVQETLRTSYTAATRGQMRRAAARNAARAFEGASNPLATRWRQFTVGSLDVRQVLGVLNNAAEKLES